MTKHRVIFLPSESVISVETGTSVRAAARLLGIGIESVCGENGTCGKCRIKISKESFEKFNIRSEIKNLTPITDIEKKFADKNGLKEDERLACQAGVKGEVVIFIPYESHASELFVIKEDRKNEGALHDANTINIHFIIVVTRK